MESKTMKKGDNQEGVVQVIPQEGEFNISERVKVKPNGNSPYHKAGVEIEVSPVLRDKMKANNWID